MPLSLSKHRHTRAKEHGLIRLRLREALSICVCIVHVNRHCTPLLPATIRGTGVVFVCRIYGDDGRGEH